LEPRQAKRNQFDPEVIKAQRKANDKIKKRKRAKRKQLKLSHRRNR